jgi:hypothetical protein
VLKISTETIQGDKGFWDEPDLSGIQGDIRWSLRWYKEQSLSIYTKDLMMTISGNPPPEKQLTDKNPFMIGVNCAHGWRNLVNTQFPGMVNMIVGDQQADYPGSSCATYETTCQIVQKLYETGKLDDRVKWDNPPKIED